MTTFRGNQAAQEALYVEQQNEVAGSGRTIPLKVLTFRRGSGTFFSEFQRFMETLQVKEVIQMSQSESDGNITLTMVYR